ncbi:MAG: riboflavin synthase [Candidatus Dormibacteria bacterium]
MFSGIVAETGRLLSYDAISGELRVQSAVVVRGARPGDSIAVNGCCLTVTAADATAFTADVMPETLSRTTLGHLATGATLNLEAALRLQEPVGGHLVSGHVDGVGHVVSATPDGNAVSVVIRAPAAIAPLIAEKGSIAVDGISLTVTGVDGDAFGVSLIPHTLAMTTAGEWRAGARVNLEADLVARYVQRGLAAHLDLAAVRGAERR